MAVPLQVEADSIEAVRCLPCTPTNHHPLYNIIPLLYCRFEIIREGTQCAGFMTRLGSSRDDRMLRWESPHVIRDLLDADKTVVFVHVYSFCLFFTVPIKKKRKGGEGRNRNPVIKSLI
jgi:hypothetical protein